ncbi:MAG TPA: hypothetical protein HPP80_08405 [Rhodospirillaceae bacterium]|nr:hypothetical protein [Rhodospirillaceae bacterium]
MRVRPQIFVLFFLLLGSQAFAQQGKQPSLLFTPDEVAAIERAMGGSDKGNAAAEEQTGTGEAEEKKSGAQPNIYVSAVMEIGKDDWTVWANGYRIKADHQPPGFQVVGVRNNVVDIVVQQGDQTYKLKLQPFQTWRSAHHDVIEGIVP